MPHTLIKLNSENAEGTAEDFTVNFRDAISLTDGNYEIALKSVYLYYSFFNVSANIGNNLISYYNGSTNRNLTIPDGNWSLPLLNEWLHAQMFSFGDYTTVNNVNKYDINILPEDAQIKTYIEVKNSYTLDLTQSTINELLGWDDVVVSSSGVGSSNANINNGTNSLAVRCSIVSGVSEDGGPSNIIHTFRPENPPGSSIGSTPVNLAWLPVKVSMIDSIRIQFTNQVGTVLPLNGEPLSVDLLLRKSK